MPEISILGWTHTIIAIIGIFAGISTLAKNKFISLEIKSGKIYLACTLYAAATALMIFAHGFFGPAHILAILTLLALISGVVVEKTQLLGKLSPYFQAMAYSATLLFHMIPAITDGLMRLPVGSPIVTDIEDPLLKSFYGLFLIIYLIGFGLQVKILRQRASS
ncbi:hypothetical protein QGN29_06515 [Temperatibacter marinus]|uniref:DUF2306 domain-containing protein n=1 Tax=Temperatibacter marinus TaxID=1456591 RepID=A0AA52HAW7_9PROT|nr:hypothetical protein [Temperatibacter marinus]WND04027.1 hypothetical protein QGN29_06515 [Temperatibacter marinus]